MVERGRDGIEGGQRRRNGDREDRDEEKDIEILKTGELLREG